MVLLNSAVTLPSSKTLTVANKQVALETTFKEHAESGCQCAEITATVGSTTYKEVHTLAPNPDSTLADVQAAIDAAQAKVAREAAGRENIRTLVSQLK